MMFGLLVAIVYALYYSRRVARRGVVKNDNPLTHHRKRNVALAILSLLLALSIVVYMVVTFML